MNTTLISVIIPVYNLAEYLPKCIDSVLAQTYGDFEIIAVDDGSSDSSAEILKEYAEKDSRMKPIFKANGGVSSARNAGLNESVGEYIFFLDGDDWIEPDTLEKLLKLSDGFDIVQAAYTESYDDGSENPPADIKFIDKEINDKNEMLSRYFLAQIQESSCNKLYKKSVIGNIRFNEALSVAEDSQFVYTILKKSDNIKIIKDITYHYYIRKNSCMQSGISEKHFGIMTLRDEQYKETETDEKLYRKFIYRYAKDIFYLIHEILIDKNKKFNDRIPALRKKLLKEKKYIFLSEDLNIHFKIGVFILWLFPTLFYKLYSK